MDFINVSNIIKEKKEEYLNEIMKDVYWQNKTNELQYNFSNRISNSLILLFIAGATSISSCYILSFLSPLKILVQFLYMILVVATPFIIGVFLLSILIFLPEKSYILKGLKKIKNNQEYLKNSCEKEYTFDFYEQIANQETLDIVKLCFSRNEWEFLNMQKNGEIKYKDIKKVMDKIKTMRKENQEYSIDNDQYSINLDSLKSLLVNSK